MSTRKRPESLRTRLQEARARDRRRAIARAKKSEAKPVPVSARQRGVGALQMPSGVRTGRSTKRSALRHHGPASRPLGVTYGAWRESVTQRILSRRRAVRAAV